MRGGGEGKKEKVQEVGERVTEEVLCRCFQTQPRVHLLDQIGSDPLEIPAGHPTMIQHPLSDAPAAPVWDFNSLLQ